MGTVLDAAFEIQEFLTKEAQRFRFIGGLALQRWGEPRATRDVDLTLLCPFGEEARAAELLAGGFPARIPDARDFAIRNRVLLLKSAGGVPIDISLGSRPRDWLDVESVVLRRGGTLGWGLIFGELEPLAAVRESPDIVARLRGLQAGVAKP
jgi:hypothetical protein